MRNKTNNLFCLFYGFIIALLFFNAIAIAQESPPEEFLFGASWHRGYRSNETYYHMFDSTGLNFISQYADTASTPKDYLKDYNFAAYNGMYPDEWIQYYTTSYYSKWEAEEDQQTWDKVGFKHRDSIGNLIGSPDTLLGRECWSTVGLTSPRDSLIYGPHYHQEKVYKRWYVDSLNYDRYNVRYTPRFIMALTNPHSVDSTQEVCRLYVVATYRIANPNPSGDDIDTLLKEITLKVSDFAPYDTFKVFDLGDPNWYKYPEEFRDPADGSNKRAFSQSSGLQFFDKWGGQGVQFCIDWLRNDTLCNLYVDYVEVYDNDGGNVFADNLPLVVNNIVYYAEQQFPRSEWPNMKYWGGPDEPSSLDHYTPMRIVDSVLNSLGAPRLLTKFYPWWEDGNQVNKDTQLVRYYNTVQPAKLMIDFFPFLSWRDPAGFEDWEGTRERFQICHTLQPGFYYQSQVFGDLTGGQWDGWRFPDTAEFKAQTMLALAHGVKGIINESFTSLGGPPDGWLGILQVEGTPFASLDGSDSSYYVYKVIKDNLVPRLKGKLGTKLMGLYYTGNYLQYYYFTPTENTPSPPSFEYLTIGSGSPSTTMNWHCGFFESEYFTDD